MADPIGRDQALAHILILDQGRTREIVVYQYVEHLLIVLEVGANLFVNKAVVHKAPPPPLQGAYLPLHVQLNDQSRVQFRTQCRAITMTSLNPRRKRNQIQMRSPWEGMRISLQSNDLATCPQLQQDRNQEEMEEEFSMRRVCNPNLLPILSGA